MTSEQREAPTVTEREAIRVSQDVDVDGLCQKYGAMIVRRCSRLLGNDDDGADAAQEVFIKVISDSNLRRIEHPGKFLWTVATNHCLNLLRDKSPLGVNKKGGISLEKIACLESGDDLEKRLFCRSILRRLFRRHPEKVRTIAVLHFVDGLTYEDTAEMVGMSVSGVRKCLQRLRDTLKEMDAL